MVTFKIVPDIRRGFRGSRLCSKELLFPPKTAGVAQLVEHLICNQRVRGSNPFASSSIKKLQTEADPERRALARHDRFLQEHSIRNFSK